MNPSCDATGTELRVLVASYERDCPARLLLGTSNGSNERDATTDLLNVIPLGITAVG